MSHGTITKGEHAMLAADAFLFAAAVIIVLTGALELSMWLVFGSAAAIQSGLGPGLGSALSLGAMALGVFAGALVAWRLHGRTLDWPNAGGMLGGALIGSAVALPVLVAVWMGLSSIGRLVQPNRDQTGPWFEVGVLVVLVALVAGWAVADALRDAVRDKRHVRLDWFRIGAVAVVVVLAGVLLPWIGATQGSELGEAGIFMLPFAAAGALAVVGADLLDVWRSRSRDRELTAD